MASYPGRGNPVLDALTGDISVRQLRVMLEHLPPGNAAYRELHSPWDDSQWTDWDISTQLRILNWKVSSIYKKEGSPDPPEPDLLPTPDSLDEDTTETTRPREVVQAERDYLQDVLGRPNPH